VRPLTPAMVPQPLLPLVGVVWLTLLRLALLILFLRTGLAAR